jgi:hypothetical protein
MGLGRGIRRMSDTRTKIEEINDIAEKICTEWEYDFMESITEQFEERGSLTEKQEDILNRIYKKAKRSRTFDRVVNGAEI